MGKIFYIMGKSASGKDTIFHQLCQFYQGRLNTFTIYTTRPMRQGEVNGREYFFVDESCLDRMEQEKKVVERRVYQTVEGPWIYFTADDGQIDLREHSYITIGTLESYLCVREYFGKDNVIPLYIFVEDGLRLMRAIEREQRQTHPNYSEVCRRFLADDEDFSSEKLNKAGIQTFFHNSDLGACLDMLKEEIDKYYPL